MSETNGQRYAVGDSLRVTRTVEGSPVLGFLGRIGRIVEQDPPPGWRDVRHLVRFDDGAEDFFYESELDPPDTPPDSPDDLMPWAVAWSDSDRPDAEGRVEGVRNPGRPTDRAEVGVATVGDVPVVRLSTVDGEDGFAATAEFPLPAARDLVARIAAAIVAASGSPPPASPQDAPRGPETGDIRENGNG